MFRGGEGFTRVIKLDAVRGLPVQWGRKYAALPHAEKHGSSFRFRNWRIVNVLVGEKVQARVSAFQNFCPTRVFIYFFFKGSDGIFARLVFLHFFFKESDGIFARLMFLHFFFKTSNRIFTRLVFLHFFFFLKVGRNFWSSRVFTLFFLKDRMEFFIDSCYTFFF